MNHGRFTATVAAQSLVAANASSPQTSSEFVPKLFPGGGAGLFGRFSLYPFLGLGAVTILSKELLIINEEFLLGVLSTTIFSALFVNFIESVESAVKEEHDTSIQSQMLVRDIAIDHYERLILIQNHNLTFPQDVKDLHAEREANAKLAQSYKELKHQHDVTNSVLHKLETIRRLEADEKDEFKNALYKAAMSHTQASLAQLPAEEKSQMVEDAIDSIPVSPEAEVAETAGIKHAINILAGYLDTHKTPKDIGMVSRIPLILEPKKQQLKA